MELRFAVLVLLCGCQAASRPHPRASADGDASSDTDVPADGSCSIFPADNPWNTDISDLPVHPDSDTFVDAIGRRTGMHPDFGTVWRGAPIGIPYVEIPGDQPGVEVKFRYGH